MGVKDRCNYRGPCPHNCTMNTGCFVENQKVRRRRENAARRAQTAREKVWEQERKALEESLTLDLLIFMAPGVKVEVDLRNEGTVTLTHPEGMTFMFSASGDDATTLSLGLIKE